MGETNHDQGSFVIASEEQLSEYIVHVRSRDEGGDALETITANMAEAKSLIHEQGGLTGEDMRRLKLEKSE